MSDQESDPDQLVTRYLDRWDLPPDPAYIREIRETLDQAARDEYGTLAKLCCDLLFLHGDPADCLLVWNAKFNHASMDVGIMIDIETMCAHGVDATLAWLRVSDDPDAADALEALQNFVNSGHFEPHGYHRDDSTGPFSPAEWAATIADYWTGS